MHLSPDLGCDPYMAQFFWSGPFEGRRYVVLNKTAAHHCAPLASIKSPAPTRLIIITAAYASDLMLAG
jgi:hypothetical protein